MSQISHLMFYLTVVYIKDNETGDITAFYAQFPDATAQGRTKKEATNLLNEIFPIMMEEKQEQLLKEIYKTFGSDISFERQQVTA